MSNKNKRIANEKIWKFFRAGGFDQVNLEKGEDILALDTLDQKLWVALACPVKGVHFDSRTLSLIDTDGDGRVRVPELLAAIQWTRSLLANPEELTSNQNGLAISAIKSSTDEGKNIVDTITKARAVTNTSDERITVEEIETLKENLRKHPFNGDGIITEDSISEDICRNALNDIISCYGSIPDLNGKPGISSDIVNEFFTDTNNYCSWHEEKENIYKTVPEAIMIDKAIEAVRMLQDKIDNYFILCQLHVFSPDSVRVSDTPGLSSGQIDKSYIEALPIASVEPDRPLPLKNGVNPLWATRVEDFCASIVMPLYGAIDTLTHQQWNNIQNVLAPVMAVINKKPVTKLDQLGLARIRQLHSSSCKQTLLEYISRDNAEEKYRLAMLAVEKLVRFQRDLRTLCTNFVNFSHFYTNAEKPDAMFLAGNLIIDQRNCRLCIKVEDINKHSMMAAMAGTYLAYCECTRKGGAEKIHIVAAFTSGDSDNLIVGRNGIFYDRSGNDWDASIVKIIENPISLRQAFWLPYKSFVRMIESNVAKRAATADTQATEQLQKAAVSTVNIDKTSIPAPQKKLDIGVVAAIGVAAGAIGTFIATLLGYVSGIIKLGPLAVAGALIGLLLLISGPALILAYIKLRKRNIGPILDASGWAVNAKARINVAFGEALTQSATLPAGSQRDLFDPFADKKSIWPTAAALVFALYLGWLGLNHFGFVYKWTNGYFGSRGAPVEAVIPMQSEK